MKSRLPRNGGDQCAFAISTKPSQRFGADTPCWGANLQGALIVASVMEWLPPHVTGVWAGIRWLQVARAPPGTRGSSLRAWKNCDFSRRLFKSSPQVDAVIPSSHPPTGSIDKPLSAPTIVSFVHSLLNSSHPLRPSFQWLRPVLTCVLSCLICLGFTLSDQFHHLPRSTRFASSTLRTCK